MQVEDFDSGSEGTEDDTVKEQNVKNNNESLDNKPGTSGEQTEPGTSVELTEKLDNRKSRKKKKEKSATSGASENANKKQEYDFDSSDEEVW